MNAHVSLPVLNEEGELERPRTRGDCKDGPRPCPWVSCKFHLAIDVMGRDGKQVVVRFPGADGDPDYEQMRETCTLDVADDGEQDLRSVAAAMNMSHQGVNQTVGAVALRYRARFETARDASELSGDLLVTRTPKRVRCGKCGNEYPIEGSWARCPRCATGATPALAAPPSALVGIPQPRAPRYSDADLIVRWYKLRRTGGSVSRETNGQKRLVVPVRCDCGREFFVGRNRWLRDRDRTKACSDCAYSGPGAAAKWAAVAAALQQNEAPGAGYAEGLLSQHG